MKLKIKRAFEKPEKTDGYRILVDRLWPRGLSKQSAAIDTWLKEVAPSAELRQWFGHDPSRWEEFKKRYLLELKNKTGQLDFIREKLSQSDVTLVYAAKDQELNNAVVLKQWLGHGK